MNNTEFRENFNKMCLRSGVDPLQTNKGFWVSTLGIGDYYYELAVQVIEISILQRDKHGALIELSRVQELIHRARNRFKKRKNDKAAASAQLVTLYIPSYPSLACITHHKRHQKR